VILVYLEQSKGVLPKSSLVAIGAAQSARTIHGYSRVVGVIVGEGGVELAATAAAGCGIDEVIVVKGEACSPYCAINHASALESVLDELKPKLLIFASTSVGRDLAPRLAHRLAAGQVSDVTAFLPELRYRRLMYAGNIVAEVELLTENRVATVRTTAFEPVTIKTSPTASIRTINFSGAADPRTKFVSFDTVASERPELTEAAVIVSGGRALKSLEGFNQYIIPLADSLGAAVGASRAAVDSGYAPNDWQVGQTGKIVAPSLYIAVGISGAIQHLAGMKDSKVIVAINKDPEAPIFEVADYGLVGDLFEEVPKLTALLMAAKNS
jgi:electron transfer flavoprotein alpha subunit